MKLISVLVIYCLVTVALARAQVGGGVVYGGNNFGGNPAAERLGVETGGLFAVEPKDSVPVSFVEASVLLNLDADSYRAVFALAQQGGTLSEGDEKLNAQIGEFVAALEGLGLRAADIYVDFVSQNRVYDFNVHDNAAEEKPSGFEVKKNVIVRYQDAALLDRLLAAAAKSSIFDLVRVDYVVRDLPAARARLLAEAASVIKQKEASYASLLGVKMRRTSVCEEKYNAYFPSDQYKSYNAYESGSADTYNLRVVRSRKTSTFYYSPQDPAAFDAVINPAGVKPTVQLTLYLKVRYTQ